MSDDDYMKRYDSRYVEHLERVARDAERLTQENVHLRAVSDGLRAWLVQPLDPSDFTETDYWARRAAKDDALAELARLLGAGRSATLPG